MSAEVETNSLTKASQSLGAYGDYSRQESKGQITKKVSFGSSTSRFSIVISHPKAGAPETNVHFRSKSVGSELSPTTYNIKRLWEAESGSPANSKSEWTAQKLLEAWAKMPSIRNRELFEYKREQKRCMGPGKYDVKFDIKRPSGIKTAMESSAERFPKDLSFCTPGPGTYGKGGIAGPQLGEEKKSFGIYSFLEKRVCNRTLQEPDNNPPPTTYVPKSSIQQLVDKKISKRGPYDLYSGIRIQPVKGGHRPIFHCTDVTYDVTALTLAHKVTDKANKKKGKWSKMPRFPAHSGERLRYAAPPLPVADAIKPGPADYCGLAPAAGEVPEQQQKAISKLKEENPLFGFGCATKREMSHHKHNPDGPGPGRYHLKSLFDVDKNNSLTSSFKGSRGSLPAGLHRMYRERLQTRNVTTFHRLDLGNWAARPLIFTRQSMDY